MVGIDGLFTAGLGVANSLLTDTIDGFREGFRAGGPPANGNAPNVPSITPAMQPSGMPPSYPMQPSGIPPSYPSVQPAAVPSVKPSYYSSAASSVSHLSSVLSMNPIYQPSAVPSVHPSMHPSINPSAAPSVNPSSPIRPADVSSSGPAGAPGPPVPASPGVGKSAGSPDYPWLFEYPLPIPPVAQPSFTEVVNGVPIQYYETTIEPFQQQVYPNLGPANLVGYGKFALV